MGPDFNEKLILSILSALFGLLAGVLVGEPLKRAWGHWLDARVMIGELIRPRFKFTIIHLRDPELEAFDFSRRLKDQNGRQGMFSFEFEEVLRPPTGKEIADLRGTKSKRDFLEKVGNYLAAARGASWTGLTNNLPNKRFKGNRDLVITNLPLPDNFYGWNSKDRTLLVISTAPADLSIPPGSTVTVEDFVIRIIQRMTVFAVAPSLDPGRDHVRKSLGCLFDFTLALSSMSEILETCIICTDCYRLIAQDRGAEFTLQVRKWVEDRRLTAS